jgi:WD40 repeat protein
VGAFDLDAKLELDADFLKEESPFEWGGVYHLEVGEYRFHFKPGADREMDFVLLPIASGSDEEFEIARRHASGRFTGGSRKIPVGDGFAPSLELQSFVFGRNSGDYTLHVSRTDEYGFFTQHVPTEFEMKLTRDGSGLGVEPMRSQAFAPGHTHDATVSSDGIVQERPVDPRKLNNWMSTLLREKGVDIHELPQAHTVGALTLDWAEGGLATGADGKIRLWDGSRGAVLETFDAAEVNRSTWVEQARWSPDGTLLAGRAGKVLRIWKPSAGDRCLKYDQHSTTISALCWRPDSKGIAAGFYGGARFYRLSQNEPHQEVRWKGSILSMAWSPNARYLAAGTQEAIVNFWKLPYRVGEDLNMTGYANKIKELAWDPTSRFLATGGREVVAVWDVSGKGPRGTRPKELHRHTKKVTLPRMAIPRHVADQRQCRRHCRPLGSGKIAYPIV